MQPEKGKSSRNRSKVKNPERSTNTSPPQKEEKGFVTFLKKAGFKVWLAVMIIGGTLAFIVALFLV